jgi:hypothetical protein
MVQRGMGVDGMRPVGGKAPGRGRGFLGRTDLV